MRGLDNFALILTILGGLNWGLMGGLQYNLIAAIFGGPDTLATRIIYGALGLAAIWSMRFLAMVCRPHSAYLDDSPYTTENPPTSTRPA